LQDFKIIFRRLIIPYFKGYIPFFLLAILGMIMFAVGTSASAYLVKPVLDEIFVDKNIDLLYLLPYAIVFVYFLKGAGKYMQVYFSAYIGQDIIRKIRNRLLDQMLRLDIQFFHQYRSGELISRNVNDVERIRNIVTSVIPEIIGQGLTAIGLLGVVIYQSPKLSFFALIILPATLIPLRIIAKKLKKVSHKSQEKTSDITSKLSEIFNNIEIIKAHAAESYEHSVFAKENLKFFKLNMKTIRTSELTTPIMETMGAIGVAAVIMVGGKEVIDDQMSVGAFFSFLTALFMLYTPIKKVSSLYTKTQDAIAASERIFFILDQEPTITSAKDLQLSTVGSLKFENIALKYGEKLALDGVSFELKKGEKLALIGDSGGGKSSIVNLVPRFFEPTSGFIFLDDTDIRDFELKSLRQSIAMVTQRVYIFRDSIAANIAYGKKINHDRVRTCLEQANALEFVENMGGPDTILEEHGTNLSGGQRQRIAIARALYINPQILIFDEATSALDTQSEHKITKAIQEVSKERITIIIAHRLSTIKQVDKIAILRHGKIIAIGSEDYLLKNSPDYKNLLDSLQNDQNT